MKLLKNHLALAAIGTLLMRVLLLGTGFLTSVALARFLGPEKFGLYSYAMAIATLGAVVVGLGLPGLAIKELAILDKKPDSNSFNEFILSSTAAIVVAGTSFAFLCILYWQLIAREAGGLGGDYVFILVAILVPISALFQLGESIFRSQGLAALSQVPELFFRRILLLILLGLLVGVLGVTLTVDMAMAAQVALTSLGLIFYIIYIVKKIAKHYVSASLKFDISAKLKSAFPFMATSLVFVLSDQLGVLVIQSLSDLATVGFYRVAFRAAELVVLVRGVADIVIQPRIASMYAGQKHVELARLIKSSARLTSIAAITVAGLMGIFRVYFLSLYGEAYAAAQWAFLILLASQVIAVMTGPVVSFLSMAGYQKQVLFAVFLSLIVNVILMVAFVPVYGLEGAAAANAVSLVMWNLALMYFAKVKLNYSLHVF